MKCFTFKSSILVLLISLAPFFTERISAGSGGQVCWEPFCGETSTGGRLQNVILSRTYLQDEL